MKAVLNVRVDAFFEEFPFLEKYVRKERLSDVPKVKRMDLFFLSCRPKSSFNMISGVQILLISKEGEKICEVKKEKIRHEEGKFWDPSTWGGKDVKVPGETVYEAIQKLPNPDTIRYALCIFYKRDLSCELVIYKIPSGQTFSEWLDKLGEIAQKELKEEIAKVDDISNLSK
jgi:hypothetical protein